MKTERKKQIKLENFFKGVRKTTRRNSFLSFLKKLRKMKFKEGHPRKKVVFKIRKVRKSALLISLFSQRTYKKGLVSAVVFIIVISLVLQGTNSTLGATYTFSQTDWSGGLDGGIYPTHTSNQSNWSKYDSKSANSSVSGGGADLSLAGTSSSITHTSDTDFSSGTNSQTQVSGTGSGAVIELNRETVVSSLGLSSGGPDNCVVSQYGEVYCWGYNASGNLGDGTTTERLTPVKVLKGAAASGDNDGTYLTNIKSVSTGYHTCAVSNSGNVYCWGNNNYGQAGDETGHPAYTPNRIPKGAAASGDNDGTYLTNVSDVSIGGNSTCATTNSGNAYCWGNGDYGQLGRNSTTSSSTPVRVLKGAAASGDNDGTYLTNVKSINMYGIYGDVNACAVTNADNLYCWGSNLSGQLGDNTTTQRLIPVRVLKGAAASGDNDGTNLTNISSVSLGETHACAASKSGNAYCWGKNANGQLGNDSTTLSNIPVRVLKGAAASGDNDGTYLTNVKSISASGYNNTYAVSNAGNPYSWGEAGYSGKLGDGTTVEKRVPARPVKGEASSSDNDGTYLTNIGDIKGGNYFGCALSASGSAYCWGDNTYGNLGDNTKTYRVSPIRVHGVSDSGNLSLLTVRYTSGNFTSIVDLGQESALTSIIFSRSAPANTTATIDARAGNIATPDGTWTSWQTDISSGGSISGLSGNRFFQYRVNLATTDTSVTPNLDSIDINYQYYGTFSTSEVSFTSSSDYTQEDAVNGTNFSSGVVKMAGSPTDSYDKLALHFDGDASASGHSAASAAGNTQLSSSISKWNGSAYFNGTSALSIPDSDDWNFGTGDFTVDLWFNPTTSGTVRHLTGQSLSGAGTDINFNLWIGADNKINGRVFQGSTAYTVVGTTATSTNTWYHVAFVRSGSNLNLYVNGVAEGGTVSVVGVTPNSSTSVLGIGRLGSYTSNYFSGYIDEFRVSKGVARWTTNFTVPSTYYSSQDSSTKLLLHLDADSSSSQNTLTMYGSSQINSATSKWNGSTYFDGAGDYWTVADSEDWNFGSGDFSIDFWMNSSVKPASNNVWFLGQGSGITNNWSTFFYQTPSGTVGFTVCTGANCYNSSPLSQDITDGQWHHLAGVRNGNTALFFVDGTQVSSLDVTGYTLNNSTSPFSIGYMDSSRFFNGYIDEVRVAKGIARYTSNFTPGQIPFGGYSTSQAYYVSTTDSSQLNTSTWSHMSKVALSQTIPSGASAKYLVSFDDRATWKYWNGSAWASSSLDDLQTNGMSEASLEALAQPQWEASGGFDPGSTNTLDFVVDLSTNSSTATPEIDNISVSYTSTEYLVSSAYNTTDTTNSMSKIFWTADLPSGTQIKFQMRTAPNNAGVPGAWTDWMGIGGTSSSYFTDSTGAEGVPAVFSSGGNDQWFQYKIFMSSTGGATPTINSIAVNYVVNASPEIQSVTASQGSDGLVNISYQVRDADTTQGSFTPGFVTPSFEYWNGSTWVACTTLGSGNTDNKAVQEGNFTTYSATWTPSVDFDNQFLNNTAKIRVTINDNEGANNTASAESAVFTLDTKEPTGLSLVINHSTNQLTIGTPTEDSAYQMAVSNLSNFSGASFVDFSSPYAYANMTTDPATVYVRIKDAYGNYSDISATTPAKPANITYYDLSNVDDATYREFIAWDVVSALQAGAGFSAYKVYRSTDGTNYSLISSVANREINYYLDSTVVADTHYYYKVLTADTSGNLSAFSSVADDVPNGTGGSDTVAPTISSLQISEINTTSARISWTTDEVSDSFVGYSVDSAYLPEVGVASYVTSHEVVLTGLLPDTTYNLRIKSRDAAGNLAQNDAGSPGSIPIGNFSFTTNPGPAISSVTIPQVANNQVDISWKTTTNSSTYVIYTDQLDENGDMVDPVEIGTPDLVGGGSPYNHNQQITGLVENTRYYFYVKSVDASSNIAINDNGGEFFEFLTTQDDDAPVVSAVEEAIVSDTQAAIHWVTNEQSTSLVKYSDNSGGPYTDTSEVLVLSRNHYVILSGLVADTDYYYKVVSSDINGNETVSSEYSFTTLNDPEFAHDPLSAITGLEESIITDQKAVIRFSTDQEAMCSAEYGTAAGSYTEVPINETVYNLSHAIHLTGLIFSTDYYYRITCEDNLETVVSSDEGSFTTLEEQGEEDDTEAATISGISVGSITGESATVTWSTDELANSLIKYGITADAYESMAGDALVNSDTAEYIKEHTVIINNLVPDTKYYYAVISSDVSGNLAESSQGSFTTKSSSSLSSIKIESQSLNEVTITWKSGVKTTSVVEYGTTEEYGNKKESSTTSTEHSVNLSGLTSNTIYHFRVKGKDADNNWYSSGDYTLEPKSPPSISGIKVSDISEKGAKISFSTNVPTDALITYTSKDKEKSGLQGKPDLASSHEVVLDGLASGTEFTAVVKVRDEDGNETESDSFSFSTGKDENPPVIDQIKTDSALALSDKVQTIVTWNTDELANSSLFYREGKNGEEREIKISENPTKNHIAVLTAFKPGTVYYFKAKSTDPTGNESLSEDYALLTPRKRENIVQIIIGNFEEIFGWAKFSR